MFNLPPEHALLISREANPYFMGGWLDMLPSAMSQIDGVTYAAVHGGGVGFEEFGDAMIKGIDRANGPSQRAFLTTKWLPAIPELVDRLEQGIRIADVGCGSGTAAILMAEAYPHSDVVGYDASGDSIAVARSRAEDLPNLEFHRHSVEDIPIEPGFDLITTLDVIHDLVDPRAGLQRIREALQAGGVHLMMEPNVSSHLENNLHDRGALLYGISTLHCMTQSLAHDGAGLGAAWGTERAEKLAEEAGFVSFQPLEGVTNRFSAFYLLRV